MRPNIAWWTLGRFPARLAAACTAFLLITASVPAAAASPASPAPQTVELDRLFAALKAAPDERVAGALEARIRALWFRSDSDTINLLMHGVAESLQNEGDPAKAERLLDTVVALAPNYAEAWEILGGLAARAGHDTAARTYYESALAIEPRQFDALRNLAALLERQGQGAAALKLLRQVEAFDPNSPGLAEKIRTLAVKVEGRPI